MQLQTFSFYSCHGGFCEWFGKVSTALDRAGMVVRHMFSDTILLDQNLNRISIGSLWCSRRFFLMFSVPLFFLSFFKFYQDKQNYFSCDANQRLSNAPLVMLWFHVTQLQLSRLQVFGHEQMFYMLLSSVVKMFRIWDSTLCTHHISGTFIV